MTWRANRLAGDCLDLGTGQRDAATRSGQLTLRVAEPLQADAPLRSSSLKPVVISVRRY